MSIDQFQSWLVERGPKIARGNYDISTILDLPDFQFQLAFGNNNKRNLNFDIYQYRVEINPNVNSQSHVTRNDPCYSYLILAHKLMLNKLKEDELLN